MDKKITTIDAYLATLSRDVKPILEEIRHTIQKVAPEATEAISYGMPTFKLRGKNLVHFAAWKHHIGFYATPSGNRAFQKELSKYQGAKGSVQFPLSEKMPLKLIADIAKYRVGEIEKSAPKGLSFHKK